MHTYGAKHSDHQISSSPIPTESQFAKFNVHQTFLLYSSTLAVWCLLGGMTAYIIFEQNLTHSGIVIYFIPGVFTGLCTTEANKDPCMLLTQTQGSCSFVKCIIK